MYVYIYICICVNIQTPNQCGFNPHRFSIRIIVDTPLAHLQPGVQVECCGILGEEEDELLEAGELSPTVVQPGEGPQLGGCVTLII